MIIEYTETYKEDVKNLLLELQQHIANLDSEGYNVVGDKFKDLYFAKTINEVNSYQGKMFLYQVEDNIVGLIVGLINNERVDLYDFRAPKRGRITELVISEKYRKQGIGQKLIEKMEEYLKEQECKDVLLGVLAYNEEAYNFYLNNGYHARTMDMTKKL